MYAQHDSTCMECHDVPAHIHAIDLMCDIEKYNVATLMQDVTPG